MTSVQNICALPTNMPRTKSKRQPDPSENIEIMTVILESPQEREDIREDVSSIDRATQDDKFDKIIQSDLVTMDNKFI